MNATGTFIDDRVVREAVTLACHAPSLHNSQPWRWVSDGPVLHLFSDSERVIPGADSSGRELLLSCGAVLDHLVVAMSAAGWTTAVERLPDPCDPEHLATLSFRRSESITHAQRLRADAILRRRTDRLAFGEPVDWAEIEPRLRMAVIPYHVMADVVLDADRPQLAKASRLTEELRQYDPSYEAELEWWTSPFASGDGVPLSALASATEAGHLDVARVFPTPTRNDRRHDTGDDHSRIFVLSTHNGDARLDVLRCGEALSAVLLEGTLAGLASCTLTHMTEMPTSREIIRLLTRQTGTPQLLIRFGAVPPSDDLPMTPRRPLAEVMQTRH